jgi:hypothetical protein
MYTSTYSVFSDYHLSVAHKPSVAAQAGPVVTHRPSPVLSRQELQRLILDMVD